MWISSKKIFFSVRMLHTVFATLFVFSSLVSLSLQSVSVFQWLKPEFNPSSLDSFFLHFINHRRLLIRSPKCVITISISFHSHWYSVVEITITLDIDGSHSTGISFCVSGFPPVIPQQSKCYLNANLVM